ncbi:MAG: Acyltransferase [Verrucomicrobiales bacterium]|nr:Acyltransferase [Verrucomicrobiales bacterium]
MTRFRINEIDLLRFIAALAVVFFHYGFRSYVTGVLPVLPYPSAASVFKYGYLGVQLFFMISGFVILMTATGGSLREFIISRIIRLYPAFWVCCTITFVTITAIGESHSPASFGQYLTNMTMLSGFVGVPSIDGVYWSLFVEIRFYALVAIALLLGKIHKAQTFLIFWLAASLVLEVYPISKLRFLLITDYAPFFVAGATFFLILSQGMSLARGFIVVVSWALALFVSIRELPSVEIEAHTTMNSYVVAGIITILFAVMMLIASGRTGWFGRTRWMLAGVLTYPLYLLHQNIGFMVFRTAYSKINTHVLFWGILVTASISAYLVHIIFEKRLASQLKLKVQMLSPDPTPCRLALGACEHKG